MLKAQRITHFCRNGCELSLPVDHEQEGDPRRQEYGSMNPSERRGGRRGERCWAARPNGLLKMLEGVDITGRPNGDAPRICWGVLMDEISPPGVQLPGGGGGSKVESRPIRKREGDRVGGGGFERDKSKSGPRGEKPDGHGL